MKAATNHPHAPFSSNNLVISNYQSIPQTFKNTQRISRNCNIVSTKNIIVQQKPRNFMKEGTMNYNIVPECSYSAWSSRTPAMYSNVPKVAIPRGNMPSSRPNYKEMLSQAYSMKKSMTERELNMKIIQRTLLCNNARQVISNNGYPKDAEAHSPLPLPTHTPLDLSTKSIKTTADSTICTLDHRTQSKNKLEMNNRTIYSAPKLDFLPFVSQAAEKLFRNQEISSSAINLTTSANVAVPVNDLPSSRIRTKGELKGFNPNSFKSFENSKVVTKQSEDFYGLENEKGNIDMFDWDNTCKKLLNQLKDSNFQQIDGIEKEMKTTHKGTYSNKKNLRKKHRRILYSRKRLQNGEAHSSDEDETLDTLRIKKIESFRLWRSRKHIYLKLKNNNNNDKMNQNLVFISSETKEEQTIQVTEEGYNESNNDSIHNSSDILSSISEKQPLQKEKSNMKRDFKIDGMITRSKSLLSKRKINLRKRNGFIESNDRPNKKKINKNIYGKQRKTASINSNKEHIGMINFQISFTSFIKFSSNIYPFKNQS